MAYKQLMDSLIKTLLNSATNGKQQLMRSGYNDSPKPQFSSNLNFVFFLLKEGQFLEFYFWNLKNTEEHN